METDAGFASGLEPPYFAVIFSALRTEGDREYGATAQRMVELAQGMPGYLGIESARGDDGFGITVSYWRDEASIAGWRKYGEHRLAQERGKLEWYSHYELRIARVERAYSGPAGRDL
jgi:heme-degrading monooxygenase HmoA